MHPLEHLLGTPHSAKYSPFPHILRKGLAASLLAAALLAPNTANSQEPAKPEQSQQPAPKSTTTTITPTPQKKESRIAVAAEIDLTGDDVNAGFTFAPPGIHLPRGFHLVPSLSLAINVNHAYHPIEVSNIVNLVFPSIDINTGFGLANLNFFIPVGVTLSIPTSKGDHEEKGGGVHKGWVAGVAAEILFNGKIGGKNFKNGPSVMLKFGESQGQPNPGALFGWACEI